MTIRFQQKLLMASIFGLAWWFFGNMYEQIVISPNWVVDSPEQMMRLHEFFVVTTPTIYFVPITQLATVLVWGIYFLNKSEIVKPDLKRASFFALLATLLNAFIVTTIVLKLFAGDFEKYGSYLTTLTWRWNVLNVLRMALVGITIHYAFNAYRKLDRI
jgi:hypothetical protein